MGDEAGGISSSNLECDSLYKVGSLVKLKNPINMEPKISGKEAAFEN